MATLFSTGLIAPLRPYIAVLFCLLLCACGSGGSSDAGGSLDSGSSSSGGGGTGEETQGVFNGAKISGLFYQTPSFSGFIEADGVFRYRDGENVRFALGGIELGSARGEPQLNLFDLAGSQPIVDEQALRAELENRARVTALDRVANMAILLATLDRDRDLSNGIDLSGWNSELADYQVDFEFDLFSFPQQRSLNALTTIRTAFAIDYEVPLAAPLLFLYESLDLTVSAHLPVREAMDTGDDGSVEHSSETRYNDFGLAEEVRRTQIPGNGETWKQLLAYTYDREGRLLRLHSENDSDGDDLVDYQNVREYRFESNNGLLIESSSETGNPELDERAVWRNQYDSGGNQTLSAYEQTEPHPIIGQVKRTKSIVTRYTGDGLVRDIEEESEMDGDGRPDYRQRIEYGYSAAGLKTSSLTTLDGGSDEPDGMIERRTDTSYQYDSNDRLIREEQRTDGQGDGVVDSAFITRKRYDNRGLLIEETRESDRYADGSVESRQSIFYSYDASGNRTRQEMRFDGDVDGNPEQTSITEYSYNSYGQLLLTQNRTFFSDGTTDREHSDRRTYGDFGEMLSRRTESSGSSYILADTPVVQRWSYQQIDNGLRYLIDHYRQMGAPASLSTGTCSGISYGGGYIICGN
ncbi:hypothetical protein [Microbulbifer mangrovi]|uniref:hypothetical protein n=1 Tax=Microbulbifer mangrovi TaxID=927787 RepID=UPI00099099CD|nr:hypothetical protein [Microbulbifer mangrovi]